MTKREELKIFKKMIRISFTVEIIERLLTINLTRIEQKLEKKKIHVLQQLFLFALLAILESYIDIV